MIGASPLTTEPGTGRTDRRSRGSAEPGFSGVF
jgi:hypothetical protein